MYNSKEALKLAIFEYEKDLEYDDDNQWVINVLKGLKELKQDLENLEKENQELLVNKNVAQGIATKLKEENTKLKKVIEVFKSFKIILKDDGNELYTLKFAFDIYGLTPEEYKLFKEILKNE